MSADANAGSQWNRVAAELRACREAQQRAWGDIDNTTLGRYLADEVSREEREQIESALNELPELRKLTELVRDVLGQSETVVSEPASVPYGPAILPYPQTQALPAAAMRPISSTRSRTPGPARSWKHNAPVDRFRQRAALVAAATVLLTLGVALPRSRTSSPSTDPSLALTPAVASRGDASFVVAMADDKEALPPLRDRLSADRKQQDNLLARIDASVQALQAEGKNSEADTLARQYARNLTRQALFFQEKGDLVRAEPALNQARELYSRTLGPKAPETIRNRKSLADVYAFALNSAPSDPYASKTINAPSSSGEFKYITSADRNRKEPHQVKDSAPLPSAPPPPRGSANPLVRSSSAYAPSPTTLRKSASSAKEFALRQQLLMQKTYQNMTHRPATTPPPPAAVALCERLTNQSQSELKTSVVPVLTQALREATDASERQRLARALGQLGPAARDSVPVLLDCYRKAAEVSERSALLLALGQVGPSARQAVPVLLQSLRSGSVEVRECAARALVQLGPAARASCRAFAKKDGGDALVRDVQRRLDGPEGRIGIDDECDCFSVKAIQQTQQEIRRLAAAHHIEVLVETARHATDGVSGSAEARKREMGEQSVYLRVNKDAPTVQVLVSDALQRRGLTEAHLRQAMEPYLKSNEYDRGLREAIRFVARFEKEHGKK